jgi:DNA-binding NtrC family response regulator
LNGTSFTVPPLRRRQDDIVPIAEHFAEAVAAKLGRRPPAIGKNAAEQLLSYPWPGNVRELRNVIDRAVVVCKGAALTPEDLALGDDAQVAPVRRAAPAPKTAHASVSRVSGGTLSAQVEAFEKELILDALERSAGNQSKAARLLGISRRVLILRLEQYGVPRPRKGSEDEDVS